MKAKLILNPILRELMHHPIEIILCSLKLCNFYLDLMYCLIHIYVHVHVYLFSSLCTCLMTSCFASVVRCTTATTWSYRSRSTFRTRRRRSSCTVTHRRTRTSGCRSVPPPSVCVCVRSCQTQLCLFACICALLSNTCLLANLYIALKSHCTSIEPTFTCVPHVCVCVVLCPQNTAVHSSALLYMYQDDILSF